MPELDALFVKIGATNEELIRKLEQSEREIREFGNQVKTVGDKSAEAFTPLAKNAERVHSLLSDLGGRLQMAGLAISAFVGGAIYQFSRMEQAVANVVSLLDAGLSLDEVNRLKQEYLRTINDIAVRTGVASEQLSVALYNLVSAGLRGSEALEVLEQTAKASVAGLAGAAETAKTLASVMNAYGYSADQAQKVSDILFKTVQRGVTTFSEIAQYIGQVTSVSAALGISLEEVAGILAYATRNGIAFNRAVTQLRSVVAHLVAPTEEAKKAMQELGVEINENTIRNEGLLANLAKLRGASVEQLKTIIQVQEALPLVTALLNDIDEALLDYREMLNSANATQVAFERNANTLSVSLSRLKEAGKSFLVAFASPLASIVGRAAERVSELATSFSSLSPTLRAVVSYTTAFAGAGSLLLGTLLKAGVSMARFRQQLLEIYGTTSLLVAGWTQLKATWATVVSAITSPLGMMVAGIGAVASAFALMWRDMVRGGREAQRAISELRERINELTPDDIDGLARAWEDLRKIIDETANSTNRVVKIMELLGKVGIDVSGISVFRNAIDALIERAMAIGELHEKMAQTIPRVYEEIANRAVEAYRIQGAGADDLIAEFLRLQDEVSNAEKRLDVLEGAIDAVKAGLVVTDEYQKRLVLARLNDELVKLSENVYPAAQRLLELKDELASAGVDVSKLLGKTIEDVEADIERATEASRENIENVISNLDILKRAGVISLREYVDVVKKMYETTASDEAREAVIDALNEMLDESIRNKKRYLDEIRKLEEQETRLLEEKQEERLRIREQYENDLLSLAERVSRKLGEYPFVDFESADEALNYIRTKLQEIADARLAAEQALQDELVALSSDGVDKRIAEEKRLADVHSELVQRRLEAEKELQEELVRIQNERAKAMERLQSSIKGLSSSETDLRNLVESWLAIQAKTGKIHYLDPEDLFEKSPEEMAKEVASYVQKYGGAPLEALEEVKGDYFLRDLFESVDEYVSRIAEKTGRELDIQKWIEPFEEYQQRMDELNQRQKEAENTFAEQMEQIISDAQTAQAEITKSLEQITSTYEENMKKVGEETEKELGKIAEKMNSLKTSLQDTTGVISQLVEELRGFYPVAEEGLPDEFLSAWREFSSAGEKSAVVVDATKVSVEELAKIIQEQMPNFKGLKVVFGDTAKAVQGARDSVQSLKQALDSLPTEKTVTVKVRYVNEGGASTADLIKGFRNLDRVGEL